MISEKDYNEIYQKGYEDGKNDNITKIEYSIKPSFTTRKLKELQKKEEMRLFLIKYINEFTNAIPLEERAKLLNILEKGE